MTDSCCCKEDIQAEEERKVDSSCRIDSGKYVIPIKNIKNVRIRNSCFFKYEIDESSSFLF